MPPMIVEHCIVAKLLPRMPQMKSGLHSCGCVKGIINQLLLLGINMEMCLMLLVNTVIWQRFEIGVMWLLFLNAVPSF